MNDYFHSSAFIDDWNNGRKIAFQLFYDAYWSRIYFLQSLHLKDTGIAERARKTFDTIFKVSIYSFEDLLKKTYQTARQLAFPLENIEVYDDMMDRVHVEYIHRLRTDLEETFGPFDHIPSVEEWRQMFEAYKEHNKKKANKNFAV